MKSLFVFIFAFVALITTGRAQILSDPIQQAVLDLYSQILVFPQEKIYLQTDRPYYVMGEKIFFRAFLLRASVHCPSEYSRYVYVELINPNREVILRQQICMDDNYMFYGALSMPESLPQGNYRIRAYTRYMENTGEESFFSRPVFIANPHAVKTEMETDFKFSDAKKVIVGIRFKNAQTKAILHPQSIIIQLFDGETSEENPNAEGWVYKTFNLKEEDTQRTLQIRFPDENQSFETFLRLPYPEQSPEVNFYPEGGNLIAGQANRIAFKALLPNGNACEIKGSIFNSKDEKITDFSTFHEGMGSFMLQPEIGEKYFAHYSFQGLSFQTELPQAKTNTYSLQAIWRNDSLSVHIQKSPGMVDEKLYLLIVCRGMPSYLKEWKETITLDKNQFFSGVSHLMLLTGTFQPLSNRMVFVNHADEANLNVQTNKTSYRTRERVELDINLPKLVNDTILPSTFSISVTDNKDITPDTTTNIRAEILLASELKGRIRHPAWYLNAEDERASQAADLLMLTHGWRRYHVPEALQRQYQKPAIKPEISQSFTGVLKKSNGKVYKNTKIRMDALAVDYDYADVVRSDEEGRYRFDGFEFPDSTAYMFLTYTNEKTEDIEIHSDKIVYPPITLSYEDEINAIEAQIGESDFVNYITKADRKYRYENGERMIDLPELLVKARSVRKKEREYDNQLFVEPDRRLSVDRIGELNPATIEDLLNNISGVYTVDDKALVRGSAASFLINGIPARTTSLSDLSSRIHVNEIAQVDVYSDIAKRLVVSNGAMAIAFTTYPPGSRPEARRPQTNKKTLLPLGYQKPIEFYSPRYENPEYQDETPDVRTAIYWNPQGIFDKDGNASVELYTADTPSDYSIVIEGVCSDGRLIYYRNNLAIQIKKQDDKTN